MHLRLFCSAIHSSDIYVIAADANTRSIKLHAQSYVIYTDGTSHTDPST